MKKPVTAYKGDNPYIFVSYSHVDSSVIYEELNWLQEQRFNLWYDEGIEAGTQWREELALAIESAKLFVFFVTPNSAQSENCRKELNYALNHQIPIVAVHLVPTNFSSGMDLMLSDIQAILKHEMTVEEYRRKLNARIANYLAQPIPSLAKALTREKLRLKWPIAGAVVLSLTALFVLFMTRSMWLPSAGDFPIPSDQWIQLTNFPDSVSQPALSSDGRMLTFIRGPGPFVTSGQIYSKLLPDGASVQLTEDGLSKMSPVFSPDGSRIVYTGARAKFELDTWQVPALGGEPDLWLPNASGLTWIDDENILFSVIIEGEGIHMKIMTAKEARYDPRDIYVPEHESGMAHRAYASPDGEWAIIVEMDETVAFIPCQLVPLRATGPGRQVGPPEGGCTVAAWSPDGNWMYFTSSAGGANHIWRQRFPDGDLQQITSGTRQEEGIAIAPDGNSFITAVANKQSSVWVVDGENEYQVSSEGYAFDPEFTPDGRYLLYRILRGPSPVSDVTELWRADLETGSTSQFLPGFQLFGFNAYDISADGSQVVIASPDAEGRSRLWLAPIDRSSPPQQIPNVQGYEPFFGADGEIFFRAAEERTQFAYRINVDGTELRKAIEQPVVNLDGLSPDGDWLIALADDQGKAFTQAFPLDGGDPIQLYNGAGTSHKIGWTVDGSFLLLPGIIGGAWLEGGAFGQTAYIPIPPGEVFPEVPAGGYTPNNIVDIPGVILRESGDLVPGPSPDVYAYSRQTVQRNLYRIPLR